MAHACESGGPAVDDDVNELGAAPYAVARERVLPQGLLGLDSVATTFEQQVMTVLEESSKVYLTLSERSSPFLGGFDD